MPRSAVVRALALAAVAACSSGTAGAPVVSSEVRPAELYTPGVRYNLTTVDDKNVHVTPIGEPLDSVWAVLPGVFLELGVDPGTIDPKQHYIANTSFKVRRSLGDVRISKYMDCGSSVTGKTADQSELVMSLTVQVEADSSDASTLRTQVDGNAYLQGAVANAIHCASTGALEDRISHMVDDLLQHRKPKSP